MSNRPRRLAGMYTGKHSSGVGESAIYQYRYVAKIAAPGCYDKGPVYVTLAKRIAEDCPGGAITGTPTGLAMPFSEVCSDGAAVKRPPYVINTG